jgi:hypothetical protein
VTGIIYPYGENNKKYMAITSDENIKDGTTEKELEVTIDNGDLKLVDSLVEAYEFKDRNSLFKFALAALLLGNNEDGMFTIKVEDNKRVLSKITPSEDMLSKKNQE